MSFSSEKLNKHFYYLRQKFEWIIFQWRTVFMILDFLEEELFLVFFGLVKMSWSIPLSSFLPPSAKLLMRSSVSLQILITSKACSLMLLTLSTSASYALDLSASFLSSYCSDCLSELEILVMNFLRVPSISSSTLISSSKSHYTGSLS